MSTLVTPHFALEEFARKPRAGFPKEAPYPQKWIASRLRPLCEQLEIIRGEIRERLDPKAVVHIGSGYREPEYNRAIPGTARLSQHMEGRAADLVVAGVPASKVHRLILDLILEKKLVIGGLGFYGDRFVHVDIRPAIKLVRWDGPASRKSAELDA